MVLISVAWVPIINAFPSSQLFNYIQSVTSYLAPPVCSVYVLGIFAPRINEQVFTAIGQGHARALEDFER
jgi:hypothetical protein